MPSTVVVGLDGANRAMIQPWIEDGTLPTLGRILSNGVSGELRSMLPPVTSPNWKAYSTGKNPGKLGVFWWHNVDVANRRVYLPRERYHDHDEYWELIANTERVGVVNVPTTYPPKGKVDVQIAGPPDGRNSGYASPPELESWLEAEFDYRVTMGNMLHDDTATYEEVLDLIDLRFRVAKRLLDEHDLDFLHVTTFYLNSLHHHLWDGEYTKRGWEIVDRHLATLVEDGHDLVLMSDHGHAAIEVVFNANVWLEENGYLTYDSGVADRLHATGIHTDRLKRLLLDVDRVLPGIDLQELVERTTPQWLLNRLPDKDGELGGSKHEMIDWTASDAVASAQGPVYLTATPSDPEYEPLRDELIEAFESLTGPDGRPVVAAAHRREDVYDGPYLDEAPDIVIDKMPHVNVREGLGGTEVFPSDDPNWRGVNRREGLFAAIGPSFTTGTVEDVSILDLAPTLLHLHDVAVPTDMDGRVVDEVFDGSSTAANTPTGYASTDDARDARCFSMDSQR